MAVAKAVSATARAALVSTPVDSTAAAAEAMGSVRLTELVELFLDSSSRFGSSPVEASV